MAIYTISTNPKNIDNIKYWFDSSDVSTLSLTGISSATASVISIKDKINGVVLTSTGTVQPTYYYNIINNNNSIYFGFTNSLVDVFDSQAADRLSSSSCTFSSIGSIYSVTKWGVTSSGSLYQFAISITPSSRGAGTFGDFQVFYTSNNALFPTTFFLAPANAFISSTVGPSFNTIIGILSNSVSATPSNINNIEVDIFGSRNNDSTLSKLKSTSIYDSKHRYTNVTYSISSTSNRLAIGDYFTFTSGDFGFRGYFCEMLYYDRYLSDNEHEKVIQYLKNKWINS